MGKLNFFKSDIDFNQIMANLQKKNMLVQEIDSEKLESTFKKMKDEANLTPWYIYVMIGFGAWLSAILCLGALFAMKIIDIHSNHKILGVVFLLIAIVLCHASRKQIFLDQLALVLNITGHILFIMGVTKATNNITSIFTTIIILQTVMFFVYSNKLQRFVAPVTIIGALLIIMFDNQQYKLYYLILAVLCISSLYLWIKESYLNTKLCFDIHKPLAYGVIFSIPCLMIFSILPDLKENMHIDWRLISTILTISILYLEYYILSYHKIKFASLASIIIFLGTIVICAIALKSPGLIAAIFILLLGFHRGNFLITGIAVLFLINFLIFYYYNICLEMTLLYKSLVLMAMGLAFIIFRLSLIWLLKINKKGEQNV